MKQDLENDRRADIDQQLRQVGIDPEQLTTKLLDDIYKLPDCHIGTLTGTFLWLRHVEFGDQELDKGTAQLLRCGSARSH